MKEFSGLEYLKIDIANNYGNGVDKYDFEDRINWFNTNENNLQDLQNEADNPALFFAGLSAYSNYKKGKPSGYGVSLDASAQGLQLLSVLIGCKKSASLCNLIYDDSRGYTDVYSVIHKSMLEKAKEENIYVDESLTRKEMKDVVMTALYGSEKEPRELFGNSPALDLFYRVLEEEVPGAWELNKDLISLWDENADIYKWVMPDNFHVNIKIYDNKYEPVKFMDKVYQIKSKIQSPKRKGKSLSPNICHSVDGMIVREMIRRCSFDKERITDIIFSLGSKGTDNTSRMGKEVATLWDNYLKSGFLSTRILYCLNKDNIGLVDNNIVAKLLRSLPDEPFDLSTVHDCFRALPNYGNDVRKQYRNIMTDISKSNLLGFIIEGITGKPVTVYKKDYIHDLIRQSEYMLS